MYQFCSIQENITYGFVIDVGRYYAVYGRNDKLELDKSKYNQLRIDDVRFSTDAQQRWTNTPQQAAFASEPQYCLYAAEGNNV